MSDVMNLLHLHWLRVLAPRVHSTWLERASLPLPRIWGAV